MKMHILLVVGLIALTDICDTISQLILKSSINSINSDINSIKKALHLIAQLIKIPRIWLGFFLSGVSLLFWLFVLSKTDLNLAFSLDSMRYIMIALASALILKEKVGTIRWLGIMCVVFGIVLVIIG